MSRMALGSFNFFDRLGHVSEVFFGRPFREGGEYESFTAPKASQHGTIPKLSLPA